MRYKDITKDMVDAARRHLSYDAESGIFTWILPTSQRVEKGSQAGSLRNGYIGINIHGERFQAHRLAVAFIEGYLIGDVEIDHIDRNRTNNAYDNLRKGSRTDNMHNLGVRVNNKTGYRGIHLHKGKFDASITVNSRKLHIGRYDTFDEALRARKNAESIYY